MEKVKKRNILLVILITIFVGCLIGGGLYLYSNYDISISDKKNNIEQKQNEEGKTEEKKEKENTSMSDEQFSKIYEKCGSVTNIKLTSYGYLCANDGKVYVSSADDFYTAKIENEYINGISEYFSPLYAYIPVFLTEKSIYVADMHSFFDSGDHKLEFVKVEANLKDNFNVDTYYGITNGGGRPPLHTMLCEKDNGQKEECEELILKLDCNDNKIISAKITNDRDDLGTCYFK